MRGRVRLYGVGLAVIWLLAACGGAAQPAADRMLLPVGTTGAAPRSAAAIPAATASRAPEATPIATSAPIPASVTPEGYHVLGRPDAPVTIEMFSDFL